MRENYFWLSPPLPSFSLPPHAFSIPSSLNPFPSLPLFFPFFPPLLYFSLSHSISSFLSLIFLLGLMFPHFAPPPPCSTTSISSWNTFLYAQASDITVLFNIHWHQDLWMMGIASDTFNFQLYFCFAVCFSFTLYQDLCKW